MCSLSRNDSFPYCLIRPFVRLWDLAGMAFIYLKYALGFRICCLPYIMLWLQKYSLRIDIISCAILETFYILVFRLADLLALSRTAPYSRLLFGCRFCLIRAKQLPGPLAIGSVDPLLFGLQAQAHPGLCKDLLAGKGALLEFC